MNVFVITCNDSVEHVVKGTENFASDRMAELKEAYYARTTGSWTLGTGNDRKAYDLRCHWAVRSTPMTEQVHS